MCAQNIGTIDYMQKGWMKSENGLIISWQVGSKDSTAEQVRIFDRQGHPITSLNVLRLVPDAQRVSIYDVSARQGRAIAVSAVYTNKEGNRRVRPAAALLLFDLNGRLLSFFSLAPSREILRLAVDEDSNVWTLAAHADDKDPATMPMVVEYTVDGGIAKELLTRNAFPFDAAEIRESAAIGRSSMGYEGGSLWFWLPGSTDLVTIHPEGATSTMKTGMPRGVEGQYEIPVSVFRETSGNVVAEFREGHDTAKLGFAYYTWSPSNSWTRFKPGICDGDWLIGVSDKEQVYVGQGPNRNNICTFTPR
jgi:hypothetical protein